MPCGVFIQAHVREFLEAESVYGHAARIRFPCNRVADRTARPHQLLRKKDSHSSGLFGRGMAKRNLYFAMFDLLLY